MTLDERLQYCRICENRKMNFDIGLVCGLTSQKPAFENQCPDFKIDQKEADRLVQLEREAKEADDGGSFMAPEKKGIQKGILEGVIMIAIAVIWFIAGLAAGYVFFYPPILLLIGIYALVKGIINKNLTGKKEN